MTLKALRLVNKKFADIAARYLFKTLTIFQHQSSWRKIELIAHCPRLVHLVKKLEVVNLPLVDNPGTFEEWKQRSQGYRMEGHLRLGNRGNAVAELVEPLDDKLAGVLRLQQRYQTWLWWYKGQGLIEGIAASSESHEFQLSPSLPALSEIETAWPMDLWIPGQHPGRGEREGNFRPGIVDMFGPPNPEWNAHLSFALMALHDSELKITTLELHHCREILTNQTYPVPSLNYLKHLKLHFCRLSVQAYKHLVAMVDGQGKPEWILAPCLANAENIETLILTQDLSTGSEVSQVASRGYTIIHILSTAPWPKLRSVWFDAVFTNSVYLLQFLMMHGNSLRSIHIDRPVSDEGLWQFLASRIRTQCANSNCVISCSEDTIFRSKSACVKELDLAYNEDDWLRFDPDSRWFSWLWW